MSLPRKEECGLQLSSWNASASVAGVPIKKRRFLFTRSPSPPPSRPTAGSADNGDIRMEEATSLAVEPSDSGVAAQVPDTGCAGFSVSPMDGREKNIGGRQMNIAQEYGSFPSYGEGLLSTLNVTTATELGLGGKIIHENGCTVRPVRRTVPETIEFRAALMDGSFGNKLILSEKSAFQRVLANTELALPLNRQCEPSSCDLSTLVSSATEGEPSSCKLELTLSESASLIKEIDCGLEFSHVNQHRSRTHWDLNTTMDTWESSTVETTADEGEAGGNKVGFRSIHDKQPETEHINKNPQESTGVHVLAGKHELSENACNLKLPNTLKPAIEKSGINTNLNLQLNMNFGSMPTTKVSVPFAPPTPCLHKASDSSLSAVRPTATRLNLTACGDVKTEPVEDVGNGKYTGTSGFEAINHNIVKPEAVDIVHQGCVKVMCSNGLETACGGAVKLEQLEVPFLEAPWKPEVKAHDCDAQETMKAGEVHHGKEENAAWSLNLVPRGVVDSNKMKDTSGTPSIDASCTMGGHDCDAQETVNAGEVPHGVDENSVWSLNLVPQGVVDSIKMQDTPGTPSIDASCIMGGHDFDAQETVKAGEVHHGKDENAVWSLNLVPPGVVDSNKMQDTPGTPSIDASCIMGGHGSKVAPVAVGVKTMVPIDSKLDLSRGTPSNSEQSHGASPTLDSSVVSESVVSDANDSHNAHLTSMHVVLQDDEENISKTLEISSETRVMVCNEPSEAKGANDVGGTSDVHVDSGNKEQRYDNFIQGNSKQTLYSDNDMQLPASVSMDVHTSDDKKETEDYAREDTKKRDMYKIENEPCGSHEAVSDKEKVPKQHCDDDDYEDGELRESLLRDAFKGNTKEKKDVSVKEVAKSVAPLEMSSPVPQHGIKLQTIDEAKDVHCTVESEIQLCPEKTEDGLNIIEYVKESSAIEKPTTECTKKKTLKISRKMSQDFCKENSESKPRHNKMFLSSHGKSPDKTGTDLGSQQPNAPAVESGPTKTSASEAYDASKQVKDGSDRSHIMHLSSPTRASSGRIKALHSRSSSRSEKERIKDKSVRREKIYMKSSRDDTYHRPEKVKDLEQALRKGGSDRAHMRGRIIQQYGDWDPDHGYASEHFNMSTSSQYSRPKNASEVAGRTGKKHVDDELCRPPPRRPSPGGSGSLPVQMVRRTMRDISPGRCTEEGFPDHVMLNREGKLMRGFADDMDNSPMLLRSRPNYEPGRNCLIRRERSLSPFQRRAAPHVSNISFASSTRSRAHSPHMWSPSRRRPEVFDGHPDMIRCRSPDLRVERVRSPGERACFQDNMLGRRHISHMAQMHGEMPDVNLMRGHDLPKLGRPPQGNLRRFDLIDHRVNPDNFGHLQPGQFHGIEGDDAYAEERRNSDEGHGLARSFRQQHYIVEDDVGNDGAFHHRAEDNSPRPIRLCQDADEEFPGRGVSRVGNIRNRLGNVHGRRLRGMDEQEDNYRQDDGQGWHGARFKDVRLKRRRF